MKLTLTRGMVDDLLMSEVGPFFDDHGREPEGTRETVGRRAFAGIVEAAAHGMGKSVTITLTGEALAYAANDRYGPFETRADILSYWEDPGDRAMGRAFAARQRACAEALKLSEPRTTSDPITPTPEQRVAETQTGDAPAMSRDLTPEQQAQYRRTYPQVAVAEAILRANRMPLDPGMPLSAENADAILAQPQARHIARLIDQVIENRADGGTLAQVATMAVRNLVSTTGSEWAALVAYFGIPTTSDWAMAQSAYGPTKGLPGLDPTFPLPRTQRWTPVCLDCWQAGTPDQYAPEATGWDQCSACGQMAQIVHVHPETYAQIVNAQIVKAAK